MYKKYFKSFFDLFFSFIVFLLLSPAFLIIMIYLYFVNDGKPFFFQERPGKNGKIFKIIKFKTMNDKKDLKGNLLPMDQRLTKTGLFLRKTSLDEIPQLINILKGDMSLIGPRPLLVEYLDMYTERQLRRHHVKPGVTGLAQVNGRNNVTWKEKFEMDIWYVDNLSFKLDLNIFFKTFLKVLSKNDVVISEPKVTKNDFQD